MRRAHPSDEPLDCLGELGPAAGGRSVVRIDSQLVERLDVAEGGRDPLVGKGAPMQCGQYVSEAGCDRGIRVACEEPALPGRPAVGRRRDRQCAAIAVQVDQPGDRARHQHVGEQQRPSLVDRTLAFCQPLVRDAKPRERLLDDDPQVASGGSENDIRDSTPQFLNLHAVERGKDLASDEVRPDRLRGKDPRVRFDRFLSHVDFGSLWLRRLLPGRSHRMVGNVPITADRRYS